MQERLNGADGFVDRSAVVDRESRPVQLCDVPQSGGDDRGGRRAGAMDLAELGLELGRASGKGSIDREEKIQMKLAATITQILPNGNFVLSGKQEVRVNFEKRIMQIDGVIRPQDISTNNTINYDQVAEARISYGGKGQITDVQQPRYGQQVYDVLFPF